MSYPYIAGNWLHTDLQTEDGQPYGSSTQNEGVTLHIQAVTISVANLARSKRSYEELLGFKPDTYYEPTRWQSYTCEGRSFFGIAEATNLRRAPSQDIVNFVVPDVHSLFEKVKDHVEVETSPEEMPWGTFKMIILDPDGYRLGFLQDRESTQ